MEEFLENDAATCPHCGDASTDHGGVLTETVYVRDLVMGRDIDWMGAVRGMNTTGACQEDLS
jgi:hypothetical protein